MSSIVFEAISITVPDGWEDVTDSLESDNAPPTLARSAGVGALQFSIALYRGGRVPDPNPAELLDMVAAFADSHGLGHAKGVILESVPLRLAAGTFARDEYFLRVWQLSDGHHFAFVTYTCEAGQELLELPDCEQIVRSLQFRPRDAARK